MSVDYSMLQFNVNHASADEPLGLYRMETMGQRIRRLREARGLTQEDLADRLRQRGAQITGNAISQWERDEVKDPKLKTFLALIDEFDTSADYLVHGPSDPSGRDSTGKFRRLRPGAGNGNRA